MTSGSGAGRAQPPEHDVDPADLRPVVLVRCQRQAGLALGCHIPQRATAHAPQVWMGDRGVGALPPGAVADGDLEHLAHVDRLIECAAHGGHTDLREDGPGPRYGRVRAEITIQALNLGFCSVIRPEVASPDTVTPSVFVFAEQCLYSVLTNMGRPDVDLVVAALSEGWTDAPVAGSATILIAAIRQVPCRSEPSAPVPHLARVGHHGSAWSVMHHAE
jgi:hypothetical protein